MFARVGTLAVSLAMTTVVAIGPVHGQEKELKFAAFIPTTAITYTGAIEAWINDVNARLEGKYQVKPYFGSVMGRNPAAYSNLVRNGVADIAFVTFGESAEVFPDTTVFELPFLNNTSLEGSLAHWRVNERIGLRGYDDFHWISLLSLSPYIFHFSKDFNSLDDLKGRKVRTGGRFQTLIIEALGMTPVSGPITSSAESISRGTWDGIYSGWTTAGVFGVTKVAKYQYDLPISAVALGIAANKEVMDGMDAASREAIDSLSGEVLTTTIGKLWDEDERNVAKTAAESGGNKIVKPTSAEVVRAKEAVGRIVDDWVRENERGREVLTAVREIIKEHRAMTK